MLKTLINADQNTNFVVIEDLAQSTGDDLFLSFLKNHAEHQSFEQIDLFCCEQAPSYYSKKLHSEKIKVVDSFIDPQSWNLSSSIELKSNKENAVFIDSLSPLLLTEEFSSLYRKLFHLSSCVKKLVVLFHGDVIKKKENIVEKLRFLSTTYIKIDKINKWERKLACLVYKKPGGKVIKQTEEYSIDSNFNFYGKVISDQRKEKVVTQDMKVEMKNLATFELGLNMSEKERAAKNNLVLPYIRNEFPEEESGRIVYEADAGDDLEEDPDDDLDI